MAADDDDDHISVTSATPLQQLIFWTLSFAFLLKLIAFVLVCVFVSLSKRESTKMALVSMRKTRLNNQCFCR